MKIKSCSFLFLFVLCLSSFSQNTTAVKLNSWSDSIQYVLGAHIGQFIATNGFEITNSTLYKKGFEDALGRKQMLVNADSILPIINKYKNTKSAEIGREQERVMFDAIKKTPGMGVLPSGVCYTIIKAGTGKRPQLNDSVQLHLKGFLPNNTLFEDTYPKNTPYKTSPSGVIAGMQEVLQIMPAGSLWRIYIPTALGFGEKGVTGLIPPYSALIYEVELLTIFDAPQK